MTTLIFDTSSDRMFVTLSQNEKILDSKIVETDEHSYNSAHLVPTIADIIRRNNIAMDDIKAIGVNIGPGSFTGLRAGVTTARVIAQQLGIPAVGVPSFQIYSMLNNTEKDCLCLMDARRGKAYLGILNKSAEIVSEISAIEYDSAIELTKSKDYFIITDARMAKHLDIAGLSYTNFEESTADFGVFLASLVTKRLQSNNSSEFAWDKLKPLYIQPPPVHQKC